MHLQNPVSNWPAALLALPDGACVKAFHGSTLREAKQRWAAAGRDPRKLTTVFRFNDHEAAPMGTWAEAVAHQRGQFARWVDGTYLAEFAPFVDLVQGANEHTATSTWQSAVDTARALQSERAAAHVWNSDYRGRLGIPAHCRITLLSGPVSNDIPRAIFELALAEDCPIDYHAYTRWWKGTRAPEDWRDDSGRWDRHEREFGLRPTWFFGECGPYINASDGWRHADVLGENVEALVDAMRAWYADVAQTAAYREGRIIGQGAWFTSGNAGWPWYELDGGQLERLAALAAEVWHPGEYRPMSISTFIVDNVPESVKAAYVAHLEAMTAHVNAGSTPYPYGPPAPPWWQRPTPYIFRAQPVNPLRLYADDRVTVTANLNYTGWEIEVFAVDPAGWLKVVDPAGAAGDRWLRAADLTPAG